MLDLAHKKNLTISPPKIIYRKLFCVLSKKELLYQKYYHVLTSIYPFHPSPIQQTFTEITKAWSSTETV